MLGGWGGGLKTAEILLAESCYEQVSFESGFKQQKGRSVQVSFESGFKQQKGRRISEIGWQRVPDRRCMKAEGSLPKRFGVTLWDFEELLTR